MTKTIIGYGTKSLFDLSIWEAPIDQIDNQIQKDQSDPFDDQIEKPRD